MKPHIKTTISDAVVGGFILECVDLVDKSLKLVKEIETMCRPKCSECHEVLTDEEIWEREREGLNLKEECICDTCWNLWLNQKIDEGHHPDDPSGKFRI